MSNEAVWLSLGALIFEVGVVQLALMRVLMRSQSDIFRQLGAMRRSEKPQSRVAFVLLRCVPFWVAGSAMLVMGFTAGAV